MSLIIDRDTKRKIRACRICLDTNSVDMVLLDEQNGWLKLFQYCFGFALTTQDEPRLLCKLCADNVESYVKFKEQCQKSDNLWRSVTFDVKCYTEKNTRDNPIQKADLENNIQNVNDSINMVQMTDESFDISFDNDSNFLNNDGAVDFYSTEIKVENSQEYTPPISFEENNIKIDIGTLDKKECLNSNEADSIGEYSEMLKTEYSNGNIKTKVKEVYTCKRCKKQYAMKKRYYTHIKECQPKKRKRQTICHQNYAYDCGRNYGRENVATHDGGVASIKNESQSDKTIEEESNEKLNQDSSLFFCGLCKLTFISIRDACKHLDEHWSNNDLACKLCDFIGVDLAAIAAHRFSHYPPKHKKRFLCHICEKPKFSLLALHFHYRLVHLEKSGGFCSRCNREFTKLRSWKKHERSHSTPGYICDICGKRYLYKHLIKDHVIEEHTNPSKYICDACGKIFRRSRYLTLHMNTVHTKMGPFKCTHCNRMYKSDHSLSLHQRKVAREKRFKCEVCFKPYVSAALLKSHMVMHSDERPHCCDICGARYKAKSQLKVHMRNHTGHMPFKCELCSKPFATSRQLKVHSSVHTGVRAHSCLYCIRTFHSKKLMLAHCALRHKNENGGEKVVI